MNFDNEQAAISQKYVVCVRVKRGRDSHTGIQIEKQDIQNCQAFANKENYFLLSFSFPWNLDRGHKPKLIFFFFFRFVNLSMI